MAQKTLIKILVAYHKKDVLFKNDIVIPIHAGRAVAQEKSKDGTVSSDDLNWLKANMIGDDTGDNISELNRDINEWTVLYWAWKNYDKLGNPDYIGLCHYRRFFELPFLKVKHFGNILVREGYTRENFESIFKKYNFICGVAAEPAAHIGFDSWQQAVQLSEQYHPLLYKEYLQFRQKEKFYCNNMFIMTREDFFAMCEECFPVAFDFMKKNKQETMKKVIPQPSKYIKKKMDENAGWYPRSTSYMMEYISCFFFMHLMEKRKTLMLYKRNFVEEKSFIEKLCSLKNQKRKGEKYKVLTILGLKLMWRKKR